ncbi:MAG: hypothetical protein ACYC55_05825, partial [Candidatus Geothermincolia bacterium]
MRDVAKTDEFKALKSFKHKKAFKIIGLVVLVGYMLISLQMLQSLKALDSKLGENGRLLGQAIEKQKAMGEKGANVQLMANEFGGLLDKLGQAGS